MWQTFKFLKNKGAMIEEGRGKSRMVGEKEQWRESGKGEREYGRWEAQHDEMGGDCQIARLPDCQPYC